MRRRIRIGLYVAGGAALVGGALVLFLTQTDPGRQIVLRRLVATLEGSARGGIVRVEGIGGNLLTRIRLHGVSITDSAGRPLLLADTIETQYGFRAALGRRVDLSGLRLVRPLFMIEKIPGDDKWNYARIFPRDTLAVDRDLTRRGWGTWIRFADVTIIDGRLITRVPWEPGSDLSPGQRERAITAALGVDNRMYVTRIGSGFQRVSDFRAIDAYLPLARLADPAQESARIDVERLRTEAYPFRPPGLLVRALTGQFRFTGDSLWWRGTRAQLSNSRVAVDGRYTITSGDLAIRLRANPIDPADVRWVFPRLPRSGTGRMEFALDWIGDSAVYVARNADVRMEGAHVRGHLGVTDSDRAIFHRDTDLRFTGLSTELLRRLFDIELPRSGTLSGHARFSGGVNSLAVNGDVTFADRSGRSRIQAVGGVGFPEQGYTFRDFRMRMNPVTVELAEVVIPDVPFGGAFTGLATINGVTTGLVTVHGDVTHVEGGRRSHALGTVSVRDAPNPWFDVNARLAPLSLATAGQFVPELALRGFVSGPLRMTGTADDFTVNTALSASDGGDIHLRGRLALGGRRPGYDLALDAALFNANVISARAPRTSLTAVAHARGVGTDPATMRGTIVADIRTSTWDTVGVDSAKVRVTIAEGLAHFDTLAVNVPHGFLEARGTLGLVESRDGELAYRLQIDSLEAFAGLIGGEPRETPPRPGVLARRLEEARADSARVATRTEVERAVTGAPPPRLQVDTPAVIPGDRVAGMIRAEGIAHGNVRRLGVRGTASGEDVVARGHFVERFTAEYDITDVGRPGTQVVAEASLTGARLAGFEFDTVHARLDHTAGRGRFATIVRQDDLRAYTANADYVFHRDHNEVHLNDVRLQFDTTVWSSVAPATVQWGGRGIEIENLELTAGEGRRLYVNGLIPTEGSADLHVIAERFELADITALLQTDVDASGLVSFDVRARGRAENPAITGTVSAENFVYEGTSLPRVTGDFDYADETLTGLFEARQADGSLLVRAEGTVPVNLALTDVGDRIPRDRQIELTVHADSFPVSIIPGAGEFVRDVRGRTMGSVQIAGTLRGPRVTGDVTIAEGAATIVPLGIRVRQLAGRVRMTGDTIVIDSLAGTSADGPVRLAGGVGVGTLREPAFDLRLTAENARLLDNEYGRLKVDAQLALYGPFHDAVLSGGVRLREGVIQIPEPDDKNVIGAGDPALFSVLDTAVAAERELFPAQSPLFANLEVDVRIRVDRDVFVRSRNANIEIYSDGDLLLTADRSRELLRLDGVILSDRGDYVFMQKRFRIRRGSATFAGLSEINPTLQATGEYEVRLPAREAIIIQVLVGGTLRSPTLELRSTAQPPLSQSDLLSYLAFGRPSASLTQLEGASLTSGSASGTLIGAGAALAMKQLATVAVGVFADEFAGEAAHAMGADVFIITPADVQTDIGNFLRNTELEFGKYLRPATFLALQARPDPASLRRPGFQLEHYFHRLQGYQLRLSLGPRYILREPTLADREPQTRSVFNAALIREWRY